MTLKYKNIFYFPDINVIGGVETFYWNLVQKYKDRDIAIFYRTGNQTQINRLRQYARVFKFNGNHIKCEKAFFNYSCDIIDYVEADEYIQILHGDYKALSVRPNVPAKITKLIGVSQLVCDTFHEVTGKDLELVYNPFVPLKPKKALRLISATRLTREKGRDRIIKLADALTNAGVPFTWEIYTNDESPFYNQNIIIRKPVLNIIDFISASDYLVQLSDTEGFCYSVVEALSIGVPVIVTDCPVFKEIGVIDHENAFILPFNMTNIPTNDIIKGLKKFTYTPPEDTWGEVLAKGESQLERDKKTIVKVKCINPYYDLQLNRQMQKGEIYETNLIRAEMIEDAHYGVRI